MDWIIYNMNQKTDFNGSVVVVQPIEKGMVDWLNGQDCCITSICRDLTKANPLTALPALM